MQPGYLGRSELPEGLKTLFRPITVMVPDLVLICENMLMAEGFVEAKILASKFYSLYALLRELLSKCLADDHQVLTSHGFLFRREVAAMMGRPDFTVAGYDASTGAIVYERPIKFLTNQARPQKMVEFISAGQQGLWDAPAAAVGDCNAADAGVSLLVTPNHDMYAASSHVMEPHTTGGRTGFAKAEAGRILEAVQRGECRSLTFVACDEADATRPKSATTTATLHAATEVREVDYVGLTWCLTMPSGYLITRRAAVDAEGAVTKASRPVVIGNCAHYDWGLRAVRRRRLVAAALAPAFARRIALPPPHRRSSRCWWWPAASSARSRRCRSRRC